MINLNNCEAEEAILGGILIDLGAMGRIAESMKPEFFCLMGHQKIYAVCEALHQQGKATDLMTVTTRLADTKNLESVGGQAKLAQLVDRTVSTVNIDGYVELIKEKWQRRQLYLAGMQITSQAEQTSIPLVDALEASEKLILDLGDSTNDKRQRAKSIATLVDQTFASLESTQLPGVRSGIKALDKIICSLGRKELIIAAARPGMGKTWFASHLALHVARNNNLPVIFFSAEMSDESLTKRFLATCSGINSQKIECGEIESEKEWEALSKAAGELVELPIFVDDTSGVSQTPASMRATLRRIKAEHGQIGLIILDYIQLLGDRAAGNRAQDVGKIAGECKAIAKEFNAPFVVLAQINRGVETRNDKRPTLSDLKDSGDIEQDADICLMLYRDEYYNPTSPFKGEIEILVRKQRKGGLGIAKATFAPETGIFK